MERVLLSGVALALLLPLARPAAADDVKAPKPAISGSIGAAGQKLVTGRPLAALRPRDQWLRARLDGLASQIARINANTAKLGPGNAAALRFRSASLAASSTRGPS